MSHDMTSREHQGVAASRGAGAARCRGSEALTSGVRVAVSPLYLPRESNPREGRWVFAYAIRIANEGDEPARLLLRRWWIVDADGQGREVAGEGVVGLQPLIAPGEHHEYTSFCPLPTPWGTMEGAYTMERPDGTRFEATIARFYLVAPGA